MERWRGERGQATSEYVALVALVAVALTLAAGLTSGGVGAHVLAGLQRGLCRVAAAECARPQPARADLAACPLERSTSRESLDGAFEAVRVAGGATLSAVRRSDGRVTVTLGEETSAGAELGAGMRIALGRSAHGARTSVRLAAVVASGRSWTLPDAAAARAFVAQHGARATVGGKLAGLVRRGCSLLCDAIGWEPHPQLPPPDERWVGTGASSKLAASLGPAGVGRSIAGLLGARFGRDGSISWYLRIDASASAALDLPLGGLEGRSSRETVVSYTADAQRRPRELGIHDVAQTGAEASARATPSRPSGARAGARAGGARVTEVDATLDLRDPANRVAAVELVHALSDLREVPALRERADAVKRRLALSGTIDRRTYAVGSSALSIGGGVALGGQLGGGFERTREEMRLLHAETRLPGLPFLPRDDCRRRPRR